jgi:hypothetical protein
MIVATNLRGSAPPTHSYIYPLFRTFLTTEKFAFNPGRAISQIGAAVVIPRENQRITWLRALKN